jgi:hypothetical protein
VDRQSLPPIASMHHINKTILCQRNNKTDEEVDERLAAGEKLEDSKRHFSVHLSCPIQVSVPWSTVGVKTANGNTSHLSGLLNCLQLGGATHRYSSA